MTKQQFIDVENPTPFEWAVQRLLETESKTNIEAIRRVFSNINSKMTKTFAKNLTFQQMFNAVELAASWLKDENLQYERQLETTTTPKTK